MSAGDEFEVRLGAPGHGGFCVGRHEGRVVFVRHGLPGELVRARVTEDRGGSFARADAVEILEGAAGRVRATCPVSGPGGAGCCDLTHATPALQRELKASVVAEQLRRIALLEREVTVEPLGPPAETGGWRTRVRLVVDAAGRAGVHGHRSAEIVPDLRCPQPVAGAVDGLEQERFTPGADLVIAVDSAGTRHVVELAPPAPVAAAGGRRRRAEQSRRNAAARRTAAHAHRATRLLDGDGTAVQRVRERRWELPATAFWQAHRAAPEYYSDRVAEWAGQAPGQRAWDLYSGAGVFAARLAEQVGPGGAVHAVESAPGPVAAGRAALADLPWVDLEVLRVDQWFAARPPRPDVVVLDPPRSGAGREVVGALTAAGPARIVHIGCDPAAFARDVGLYREAGYELTELRAVDAFPGTHHVECLALLER
ncbi:class I SAM-dependent RNA methyltransferase [Nocardia sp. NPDC057353]|uniref:class I SAM-dependent RNA methyltransferase n=1 Tax=Nocardia sp. NPDC057353 TaxID=3346104 RepID=UPI00362F53D3